MEPLKLWSLTEKRNMAEFKVVKNVKCTCCPIRVVIS
jgi:hypothetical protein